MHKIILGIVKDQKAKGLQRPMGTGQKVQESKSKGQTSSSFFAQNDVSASLHTVYVSPSFPAKKQMPSDFMAAGTSPSICHEG